ncbi:MAG: hypothetical protein A4S12_12235 [Proteobacteria bacterium SG_bin5]|nr:MAG: hypothetical protein A4S12_12235 [Proteobacteria bacterium SG_bin5]
MIERTRRLRPALMTGVATLGLVLGGGAASAQTTLAVNNPAIDLTAPGHAREDALAALAPERAASEPYGPMSVAQMERVAASRTGLQTINVDIAKPEPQVLIALPNTPTTAVDPNNITGIGQMVVAVPLGGASFNLGTCTGSLINPRTVLFAAHCVNSRAATAYGSGSGGVAIGFGFNASNGPFAAGSPVGNWVVGEGARPAFTTSTQQNFYTAEAVVYNPLSLEPAARSFLYGDVALASLDTPARNIPTWSLLFSPLPAPGQISANNGTGYHVTIAGYGRNGTGISGDQAVDFRRRLAENWLGALASIADFEGAVFAPGRSANLIQNLYWLDFDDPLRGTAGAAPLDFNPFRDNALPREGITAPGDSGGPLILDRTFARQVVIGVLSGGYPRFFNTPNYGYGAVSFYQPLYLYWDWIAANNPYRYVGAAAGNGNWEDPTRWVSLQDPNYFIIGANGQLVNGVPSVTGEQSTGTSGKFGQICVQGNVVGAIGNNVCRDVRTGGLVTTPGGIGTADALPVAGPSNGKENFVADLEGGAQPGAETIDPNVRPEPQAPALPIPAPTIANGLPGATNFVPNNTAGNRTAGVLPRYFDVTLSNAGTTTLNSTVTIDRLRINGVQAGLTIAQNARLNVLNDVTLQIGTLAVNGTLSSANDFFFAAGGINGTGTIIAPFTTSVAGVISPGATGNAGSIGTLTFVGNLILASGNTTLIDLGANGVSDLIQVNRTTPTAADGIASVGGAVQFRFDPATLRANNVYTFVNAQNAVQGTFAGTSGAFSAILSPRLVYNASSVQVVVQPGSYRAVLAGGTPTQRAFAGLLDANRGFGTVDQSIYAQLDLQNAATIAGQLESFAPRAEALVPNIGIAATDTIARFHRDRLATRDSAEVEGGSITMIGQPLQFAQTGFALAGGLGAVQATSDAAPTTVARNRLPEDMNAYLAAGFIDGQAAPLRNAQPAGGRDQLDGFFVVGGIEKEMDAQSFVGLSFSYAQLAGRTAGGGNQRATFGLYEATVYAKSELAKGWSLDGQLSAGAYNAGTQRNLQFLGTPLRLTTGQSGVAFSGEVGGQYEFGMGFLRVAPRLASRTSYFDFATVDETGGIGALTYYRPKLLSIQGRAGLIVQTEKYRNFRPYVTAYYVHEFNDARSPLFGVNFVGAGAPGANFLGGRVDRNWGEVSGGLTYSVGRIDLTVAADTTFERDDVRNQSYRGSIRFRF